MLSRTAVYKRKEFMSTLFTKIIRGDIPAEKIYEDDLCIVILDIAPVNKGHALVISRNEYETIADCPDDELSHLMAAAKRTAVKMEQALDIDGYNILINNKAASGQEIPHLHIHVIPRYSGDGKSPIFRKESYLNDEMEETAQLLRFS